jgi:hypothetical protein
MKGKAVFSRYTKKTPQPETRCIYPGCGSKTDKPEYNLCWRCYHKVPVKIAYASKDKILAWFEEHNIGEGS